MNNIDFNKTDIPLTSEVLEFLQSSLSDIQKLFAIGKGSNYILSGCTDGGGATSDGYVIINGEILPFKGGLNQETIIVREQKDTVTVQTYSYDQFTRWVEFGVGATAIQWNTLERIKTNSELKVLIDNLDTKVTNNNNNQTQALSDAVNALNTLVSSTVPSGLICMWSGQGVPGGWKLCNGSNGTPDLRDRFIIGSDGSYPRLSYGGSKTKTITTDNLPSHSHDKGGLSIVSSGNHRHAITGEIMQKDGSSTKTISVLDTGADASHGTRTKYSEMAGDHSHLISGSTGSTGGGSALDVMPPYYALAFIMKI